MSSCSHISSKVTWLMVVQIYKWRLFSWDTHVSTWMCGQDRNFSHLSSYFCSTRHLMTQNDRQSVKIMTYEGRAGSTKFFSSSSNMKYGTTLSRHTHMQKSNCLKLPSWMLNRFWYEPLPASTAWCKNCRKSARMRLTFIIMDLFSNFVHKS